MIDLCFYEGGSCPVCGSVVLELGSFERCFVFDIEVMDCCLVICLDCKDVLGVLILFI